MFFDSGNKNECSGCSACLNVCPVNAITMQEDKEGFFYPIINRQVCVECGLCRKVCSWANPSYDNLSEPQVIASVLKNKSERVQSTSGGVFFAIAQWIIKEGGVVYGAAFDNKLQLHHVSAETMDELQKLRGSKYIQSDLGNIFKDIKQNLDDNRRCYFTGTGCQVAGLKAYLRKDYPKLITSDLVCHGVPSQRLFNEHIAYMEQKFHDKIIDYRFRDYKMGSGCEICYFENKCPIINPSYELSPYLYSFIHSYVLRLSCYECRFARIPRQGDITLADYWGVERFIPSLDRRNGVSLVFLNNKKAIDLWGEINDSLEFVYSKLKDAVAYNRNVVSSTNKPQIREHIFEEIEKLGYSYVAKYEFRNPKHNWIKIKKTITRTALFRVAVSVLRRLKNTI